MVKVKLLVVSAVAAVALSFAACGGDPCTAKSKCSADPAPTDAQIKACQDAVAEAKCGSKYKSMVECMQSNQVCTSDNMTDAQATAAKCTTQVSEALACILTGALTDGGT
jgi:hypothetical protein